MIKQGLPHLLVGQSFFIPMADSPPMLHGNYLEWPDIKIMPHWDKTRQTGVQHSCSLNALRMMIFYGTAVEFF